MKATFLCVFCLIGIVCAAECFAQANYKEITTGAWDLFLSDRGVIGKDGSGNGGAWPRGNANLANYINASGIWFGCVRASAPTQQLAELSYSPTGATSFTPFNTGGAQEPVYSSADYNKDGTPKQNGQPLWCIRNTAHVPPLRNQNLGNYVASYAARASDTAVFISDQDVVSIFSDSANNKTSYPLGVVGTLTTYAWNADSLKNCVFVRCTLKNTSRDTLQKCYVAPVFDFGIGSDSTNDNAAPYFNDSLRMFEAYSDSEAVPLGFAGVALIQPARRFNGDNLWASFQDHQFASSAYYEYTTMSALNPSQPPATVIESTVRGLASSGPFTLLPDSTIQCTYIIAGGMNSAQPRNTDSNTAELIATLLAARNWWYAFNPATSVAEQPIAAQTDALRNYPNPFSAFTTIEVPSGAQSGDHIAVHNEIGQEVGQSLLHRINANEFLFDGRTLPNGLYMVRFMSAGKTYHSQIIIEH